MEGSAFGCSAGVSAGVSSESLRRIEVSAHPLPLLVPHQPFRKRARDLAPSCLSSRPSGHPAWSRLPRGFWGRPYSLRNLSENCGLKNLLGSASASQRNRQDSIPYSSSSDQCKSLVRLPAARSKPCTELEFSAARQFVYTSAASVLFSTVERNLVWRRPIIGGGGCLCIFGGGGCLCIIGGGGCLCIIAVGGSLAGTGVGVGPG